MYTYSEEFIIHFKCITNNDIIYYIRKYTYTEYEKSG